MPAVGSANQGLGAAIGPAQAGAGLLGAEQQAGGLRGGKSGADSTAVNDTNRRAAPERRRSSDWRGGAQPGQLRRGGERGGDVGGLEGWAAMRFANQRRLEAPLNLASHKILLCFGRETVSLRH